MSNKVSRNVVLDIPTGKDLFRGKGHERTAISLASAILKFDDDDRAIGLDGPWGSGKSSVVEMAAGHLKTLNSEQRITHHFFTFDIWKSQGTGFRRSFLEHFVSWAKQEFPDRASQLNEIEEDIRGRKREVSTKNQPILGYFGIIVLISLPLLPIYYFWAKTVFDELAKSDSSLSFLKSGPAWVFYAFTVGVLLATLKKKYYDHKGEISFKSALSSVLLISSKQHQDHITTQNIREIDPNDYEFHSTLRRILETVQSKARRVVVVLDNIDRLPPKEINDYWAVVRSIFSGAHQSKSPPRNQAITAIVPYDRSHIAGSDIATEDSDTNNNHPLTRLSSRELFSKTFNEILHVSPPVLSNAQEFFSTKIEEALPDTVSKYDRFRTYRIFTELLRLEGGLTTPRQVVSFVNDISRLYALHEGRFAIPTIAAYLAHQDLLSKDPGTLNDENKLDRKITDLASDPNLAMNLAAIVFNVSPDLAFEVLLDEELVSASIASDHKELDRLSKSPGFDLRIDDVVLSNTEEWISTGEFGKATENFAKVLPGYSGEAKPRVISALVESFKSIDHISVKRAHFEPLLSLFDVATENERAELIELFLQKVLNSISLAEADFDTGVDYSNFLGSIRQKVEGLGLVDRFEEELEAIALKAKADFLYGLASNIEENGLAFDELGRVEISLPEEGKFYEEISLEDPRAAFLALRQFRVHSIVSEEEWVSLAQVCLADCTQQQKSTDGIADLLEITCLAYSEIKKEQREESLISAALADGQFFRNLGIGDNEASEHAISLALFLVGEFKLGQELPVPTKAQPNGQRVPDSSEEFVHINQLLMGNSDLSDTQAGRIVEQAIASRSMVTRWTDFGSKNPEHLAAQRVVKLGFSVSIPPAITIAGLNTYFSYLVD